MLPHFTLPMVDLRDVLDLHVLALTHEKAPGESWFCFIFCNKVTIIPRLLTRNKHLTCVQCVFRDKLKMSRQFFVSIHL